jgi:predicted ATPase
MIRALHVSNYRSLAEDLVLDFSADQPRLLVLAGLNGSGKSNLLDVVRFVGDLFRGGFDVALRKRGGLPRIGRDGTDHWYVEIQTDIGPHRWYWGVGVHEQASSGVPLFSEWCVRVEQSDLPRWEPQFDRRRAERHDVNPVESRFYAARDVIFDLRTDGIPRPSLFSASKIVPTVPALAKQANDDDFRSLYELLSRLSAYSLFPPTLRHAQTTSVARPLDSEGSNWASVLKDVYASGARLELLAGLQALVPDMVDFRVAEAGGYDIPEFYHRRGVTQPGTWHGPGQESDGTLRAAAILTALLQHPVPPLVGIEEPELAIHVAGLRVLWDFIEEATQRTQVVLTTHSPDVLDLVPPTAIRVVEMTADGSIVAPIERPQLNVLRERLTTAGELHRSQGLAAEPRRG